MEATITLYVQLHSSHDINWLWVTGDPRTSVSCHIKLHLVVLFNLKATREVIQGFTAFPRREERRGKMLVDWAYKTFKGTS